MPREQEKRIKVTRTVYTDYDDSHETFTFEGDPDIVRETLYELGLFRRSISTNDNRSDQTNPDLDSSVDEGSEVAVERPKARWRQVADFIESIGPPDYGHTQALIEQRFVGRRLSATKDKSTYAAWFRPSRKARAYLQGKLGGSFKRSETANSDGSFAYHFVKR